MIPMTTAMLRDQKMMLPEAVGREGLFPPPPPARPLAASGSAIVVPRGCTPDWFTKTHTSPGVDKRN